MNLKKEIKNLIKRTTKSLTLSYGDLVISSDYEFELRNCKNLNDISKIIFFVVIEYNRTTLDIVFNYRFFDNKNYNTVNIKINVLELTDDSHDLKTQKDSITLDRELKSYQVSLVLG